MELRFWRNYDNGVWVMLVHMRLFLLELVFCRLGFLGHMKELSPAILRAECHGVTGQFSPPYRHVGKRPC
jgi:hypothetical protein